MELILARAAGERSSEQVRKALLQRDRELCLEMDSSQLNYFVLRELLELAPEAKFILTIRDCRSWLTSYIDHQQSGPTSPRWVAMRKLRFHSDAEHPPEEQALRERGLFTVDAYLSYWARHNREVLETVPSSRLLVVRTDQMSTISRPPSKGTVGRSCRSSFPTNSRGACSRRENLRSLSRRHVALGGMLPRAQQSSLAE